LLRGALYSDDVFIHEKKCTYFLNIYQTMVPFSFTNNATLGVDDLFVPHKAHHCFNSLRAVSLESEALVVCLACHTWGWYNKRKRQHVVTSYYMRILHTVTKMSREVAEKGDTAYVCDAIVRERRYPQSAARASELFS